MTMVNERFTPGPWQLSKSGEVIYSGAVSVANTYGHGNSVANAALIAAAPVMYEALKYAKHYLTDNVSSDLMRLVGKSCEDVASMVDEALAAANPETVNK